MLQALLVFVVTALTLVAQDANDLVRTLGPQTLATITADDLKRHLSVLASDEYEGRLTATRGQEMAASYIAEHFRSLGLKPLGDEKDGERLWTQGYGVVLTQVTEQSGVFSPEGKTLHRFGAWVTTRTSKREPVSIEAPLAFLGKIKKNALSDVDLAGVIPVVVHHFVDDHREEMNVNDAMGRGMSVEMPAMRQIGKQLAEAGARCGVVISPRFSKTFLSVANMSAIYPGKPKVQLKSERGGGGIDLTLQSKIPLLLLDTVDAKSILSALGLPETDFDTTFAPKSKEFTPGEGEEEVTQFVPKGTTQKFRFTFALEAVEKQATNVIGLLEGSDPELKSEAVLYSAHMDHVGLAPNGEAFNGADDDGSGTVSLLELAEAFAKLPEGERPRRSVLFVSVSGEELGLWGSAHYANHSTWPIASVIANINIDMIGRSTADVPPTAIALTPTHRHKAYSSLGQRAAELGKHFDLEMRNGDRFYSRSDHYNFAVKGIPVVFFCDDEHPDYHMPTDDVGKIEFEKMERVVRLACVLGFEAASSANRPSVLGRRSDWFDGPESKDEKAPTEDKKDGKNHD